MKIDPTTCEALMKNLAEVVRLCADMMVAVQGIAFRDPASSGGGVKGGGGPHLEALLDQCRRFDLAAREIDGLVLHAVSEAARPSS
jgi:hypothetical protein